MVISETIDLTGMTISYKMPVKGEWSDNDLELTGDEQTVADLYKTVAEHVVGQLYEYHATTFISGEQMRYVLWDESQTEPVDADIVDVYVETQEQTYIIPYSTDKLTEARCQIS